MLTQEYLRTVFEYRDGNLYWKVAPKCHSHRLGEEVGSVDAEGYRTVSIKSKNYKVHRLIYLYHFGYLPKFLDHIDGNRSNNLIDNLRECSLAQNSRSRQLGLNSTSGYKGVTFTKKAGKWCAQIGVNNKRQHIGYFSTKEEAALAYNSAALLYHKEFAKLNEVINGPDKNERP